MNLSYDSRVGGGFGNGRRMRIGVARQSDETAMPSLICCNGRKGDLSSLKLRYYMSESVADGSNNPIVLRLAAVGTNDGDKRCHTKLLKLMGDHVGLDRYIKDMGGGKHRGFMIKPSVMMKLVHSHNPGRYAKSFGACIIQLQ